MNTKNTIFYHKNGIAIMHLARDLITMQIGDRIPTITDYTEILGVGRGTIQNAISFLEETGSIHLEKQGQKGTFLQAIDHSALWPHTGWGTLLGAMPLPTGPVLASIDGACIYALRQSGFPFASSYTVSNHNRLNLLNEGTLSFVVTSKMGMDTSSERYPNIETAVELTDCTYSSPVMLLHRPEIDDCIKDGMRLGVSIRSSEQQYIANRLREYADFQVSEMTIMECNQALTAGEIDCIIGRPEAFETRFPFSDYIPKDCVWQPITFLGCDRTSTIPVIACNRNVYGMSKLVRSIMDRENMFKVQQDITTGRQKVDLF